MNKYFIIIFDKSHVNLKHTWLRTVAEYPYDKNFLYFVYKYDDKDRLIPYCKVESGIVDMTFTSSFNFEGYINHNG